MAKTGLTVTLRVEGLRETLAAFRSLPKEANTELRERTLKLSESLAASAQQAAKQEGRQARILAPTIKAKRDRVPAVTAGGAKRIGRTRTPAFKLLFGSEFGSSRLKQFKPHRGAEGYWFFPTVEREQAEIGRAWSEVADNIIKSFSEGGS